MKRIILTISAFLLFSTAAFAQVKQTENTLKMSEGQKPEKATLSDVSFLVGTWSGNVLGGVSEETWSKPAGGAMMGMYRLVKDGKPVFYELFTMSEEDDSLIMRLKHFNANMTGWEEKDKTVDFRFVKKDGRRVYFEGLTFEPVDEKNLNVYLAIRQKDGTVREEVFRYKKI